MEGGMPAWRELDLPLETSPVSDEALNAPTRAARAQPPPPAKYPAQLDARYARVHVHGHVRASACANASASARVRAHRICAVVMRRPVGVSCNTVGRE